MNDVLNQTEKTKVKNEIKFEKNFSSHTSNSPIVKWTIVIQASKFLNEHILSTPQVSFCANRWQ